MKVSVFGLGYVGSVSAGCFAALGHPVVGVDVSSMKVDLINAGRSPVIESGLDELIARAVADGQLRATTCAEEAVLATDLSLVCVGTPSDLNGNLNLEFVERVCHEIGQALSAKPAYHVVVLRSTMLPGSAEARLVPILEAASGRAAGRDFGVVFNPEFLREGTAVADFHQPPFTLIGQYDERGAALAAELYRRLEAPLLTVPLKVAEMVKYANNAFHAVKVVFANEIGAICKQQGIDSHQVMDIFCRDEKLNLSSYYLRPGFAFGGSCLPKDLRALLYHAHRLDVSAPLLESLLPSNALQVRRAVDLVRQTGRKRVGALGFSFKAGTDDLRESPMVELIETLVGKGFQVRVYDRNVSLARLHGANKAYIEREIPHIASLMCERLDDVLAQSDVIVVGNRAPEFSEVLGRLRPDQVVIDLVRITNDGARLNGQYQAIGW
jgi:GDP-mannose 6-dehydrogenase